MVVRVDKFNVMNMVLADHKKGGRETTTSPPPQPFGTLLPMMFDASKCQLQGRGFVPNSATLADLFLLVLRQCFFVFTVIIPFWKFR